MNSRWIIGDSHSKTATLVLVCPGLCLDLADAMLGPSEAALMRNHLLALLRRWNQGIIILGDDASARLASWGGFEQALWNCRQRAEIKGLLSLFKDMTRIKADRGEEREGLAWAMMACGGPIVAAGFGYGEPDGRVTLLADLDWTPYDVVWCESQPGHPHNDAQADHEAPAPGHPPPL